jgi:hypothetical protein
MLKAALVLMAMLTVSSCVPVKTPEEISREERIYLAKITINCKDIDSAILGVVLAVEHPDITNSAWKLKCSVSAAYLQNAVYDGKKLIAPETMNYIQTPYLQALSHFAAGLSLINKGLQDYDGSLIYQSNTVFDLAAPYYREAKDLIKTVQ